MTSAVVCNAWEQTVSAYMRNMVLPHAAADMGVHIDMADYNGDVISQAANKLGITKQEFMAKAARETAEAMMRAVTESSGERKRETG